MDSIRSERCYPAPRPLEPAALGGVEHGLGAVDRSQLAVDVVQVRAYRAGGERELVRDLLVDQAQREALEDLELARGERARLDRARPGVARIREVVEDGPQLGRSEPDGARGAQQLGRRDGQAQRVV